MAKKTRDNAYAVYSNFHVGAAIGIKGSDTIYPGCNVENISFGATICAERNAILNTVALNGKVELDYVVVVCDTDPVTVPCGLCLQFMSEFSKADMPVYLSNLKGIQKVMKFGELMPAPFDTLT